MAERAQTDCTEWVRIIVQRGTVAGTVGCLPNIHSHLPSRARIFSILYIIHLLLHKTQHHDYIPTGLSQSCCFHPSDWFSDEAMTPSLVTGSLLGVSGKSSFLLKQTYTGSMTLFSFWMPLCLNILCGETAAMVLASLGKPTRKMDKTWALQN